MAFRVESEVFRGPLDLLLYLVKKNEIDPAAVSLAAIADQFTTHLDSSAPLDMNGAGEFIEAASILIELKTRFALPFGGEDDEIAEDPREHLVQRLLEYKQYRDAAAMLEDRSRRWLQRKGRLANDTPERLPSPADDPIHEVELWDLVSAFGRIMREHDMIQPSNIVYDETPIQAYMLQIHRRLTDEKRLPLSELFSTGMHKSAMIGVFLAILELARRHSVRTEQPELHGELWVVPGEGFEEVGALAFASEFDRQANAENGDGGEGGIGGEAGNEAPSKPKSK